MESNHDNSIPAVDQIANGSNLQMYKAVIPYLPRTLQKNCILMNRKSIIFMKKCVKCCKESRTRWNFLQRCAAM